MGGTTSSQARVVERMTVRIVRLGSTRLPGEGPRIGTVRRPPRGVPQGEYASRDFYDVWLPNLAPSESLLKEGQAAAAVSAAAAAGSSAGERAWRSFVRRYRAEMRTPDNRALIATLAVLSQHADFSVGCYCADEARCHRSVLRELLAERGARLG